MWSLARLKEFTKLNEGWLGAVPPWLLFVAGGVLGAVMGLLVSASNAFTTGLFGLVGVALGGVISAVATERSARVAQLTQVATATWPDRVKKHQEAYLWYQKMIRMHFDPPDERIKMSFRKTICTYLRMPGKAFAGFLVIICCLPANFLVK